MKIVLAIIKESSGKTVEETFQQPVIQVGRDAVNMDIAVDNSEFRMVSRHHADIRFHNGAWMVGDMGSTYGTFLNGEKIEKPVRLAVGNSIQFGLGGPTAHVIWMESDEEVSEVPSAPAARPAEPVSTPSAPSPQVASSVESNQSVPAPVPDLPAMRSAPAIPRPSISIPSAGNVLATGGEVRNEASVEVEYKGEKETFKLDKDIIVVGRDPGCDINIDIGAVMVSRKHAEISRSGNAWLLKDNQSFNGTLVNENRISSITPLYDKDEVRLGHGGPVLKFSYHTQSKESKIQPNADYAGTMVFNMPKSAAPEESGERQLLYQAGFEETSEITVGRDESCDVVLDGLQISSKHARFRLRGESISVEDLNSTNGVYLNGEQVSKSTVTPEDTVQIGSFEFEIDDYLQLCVFDTRSKTRIDANLLTKQVKNRNGRGKIKLLDNISLSIAPNEFVGMLGPSGAGKSTLIDALNGTRPPSQGSVLINGLDLYRYINHLKQNIGYVPQSEIIHEELSVEKTLYYIAKLRLSRDVSRKEITQTIDEVLDVCGLSERKKIPVNQLSGGQRKRVAIAVELITKPSVIFLDEPTSGLDPATEEKIMKLFRQIAESGRTVILTTHAMENVKLFDKIVVLMRGKLVFYGKPAEALDYFNVSGFKDLYEALEQPVEEEVEERGEDQRIVITEREASRWRDRFTETPHFEENVRKPLAEVETKPKSAAGKRNRLGIFGSVRQWFTLSRRYCSVLIKDKFNLFILFAQAPVIAFLVFIVMGNQFPRDFAYFALSLCAIWFGTSVAAREIVRERRIYERERMVNLGLLPYLVSKYTVLGLIVGVQCLLLFVPLKFLDLIGVMPMPGFLFGIPQLITMFVTAAVGITLGLFVSSVVRTSETATSLIPLILIPQIVFSGLIGVPTGISKVVGLTMPATWSFDTMKRFSTLDTLEKEGAFEEDKGLYVRVEEKNEKLIEDARKKVREYEQKVEGNIRDAEKRINRGEKVAFEGMPDRPKISEPDKIPDDLSEYITFLHPWMNEFLSIFILLLMSFVLFFSTVIVLRVQDRFSHG